MDQPVVELTFDRTDIILTEIRALTLTDHRGHKLAYDIKLHQGTSDQTHETIYQLFIPLMNH